MKKENARQDSILGDMKPSRAITRLAVPATLALLAKAVYNIVDTAYIGMLGSDIALAAVGVTLPLLLIMVSVENIFAAGAAVLAGRQLGAGDKMGANRTVTSVVGLSYSLECFYVRQVSFSWSLYCGPSEPPKLCCPRPGITHSGCLWRPLPIFPPRV